MGAVSGVVAIAAFVLAGVPAASATPFVPGAYETTITGASPARFDGTWVLMLDGGSFTITRNKSVAVTGSITTSGNGITFHDASGPYACLGAQAVGSYAWRVTNNVELHVVSDSCSGREAVLTNGWDRFAPQQGVVDLATISRTPGGTALQPGTALLHTLWVRFHFVVAPDASSVTISWRSPSGQTIGSVTKPYFATINSVLRSPSPLATGTWQASIVVDGKTAGRAVAQVG